jgi:hypothetical protein
VKLALDHHYSPLIAANLRERGHDVVAAIEQAWDRLEDEQLLNKCSQQHRALLTNNVADFAIIVRNWQAEGKSHCGLVFTSDHRWPRNKQMIGEFVRTLEEFLNTHPGENTFTDRVHWL